MNERYIMVLWPEIQNYMDHPRYNECYSCNPVTDVDEDDVSNLTSVYMVPESLYDEVEYKSLFPHVFPNTSIGPVTCMENYAIVKNTDEYFWYDLTDLKKGDTVLVGLETDDFVITTVKACDKGFPILLDKEGLTVGINCEILGFHGKESI